MLHHYFQQKELNPFAQSFEKPMNEWMELNTTLFQRCASLMPLELLMMKKPEEMVEKNIGLFIENSQLSLDCMRNMLHLMEQHWLSSIAQINSSAQHVTSYSPKRPPSKTSTMHTNSASTAKRATAGTKRKAARAENKASSAKNIHKVSGRTIHQHAMGSASTPTVSSSEIKPVLKDSMSTTKEKR